MSWCILVNTTPKYMQYAEVQIACIRRYAPRLAHIPIFIATELKSTEGSCLESILSYRNTHHIVLESEESGFLESRLAGIGYLPDQYEFVLPLQEDFWLDRAPDYSKLDEAINILKEDSRVKSLRLMPSPGPHQDDIVYKGPWRVLGKYDTYKFTFQATLWRAEMYKKFLERILMVASKDFHESGLPSTDWAKYCIRANVAENLKGQEIFSEFMSPSQLHLSIEREHANKNAVYLAPWPYRPTAVVQGSLEPWAKEFAEREGFKLE
jgi:hypothetical protein